MSPIKFLRPAIGEHCRRQTWIACGVLLVTIGAVSPVAAVSLIQRSIGLDVPAMEEGRSELEVGDVNGDGHLDILSVGDHGSPFVNSDEHGIMTWLGDGAGNWTVVQFGNFGYGGIALGDLNRDGFLDAAWGIHHDWAASGLGSTLIGAALGDGTGTSWTPWETGLATTGESWGMFATALADFNLDGRLDILSQSFGGSNGVRLYRNDGAGFWSSAYVLSGGSVSFTIETGDFNADGFPDYAGTRSGGTAYLGDGDFGFAALGAGLPAGTKTAVDIGDLDGDGHDDLLLAISGGGVHACRFDPTGPAWIDLSAGLPTSGSYDMVQFGDINGDGFDDVVTFDAPSGRIYLGDGAGNWLADASWTMPSPGTGSAMRVDGDIDHDGREDIVVTAKKSGFPFSRNQLRVYSPWEEPTSLSARVESPKGGETYIRGGIRVVRWAAALPLGVGEATVNIRLSLNGEAGPWTSVATSLPNSGRYEWKVAASAASANCRLELDLVTLDETVTVRSANSFAIANPAVSSVPEPGPKEVEGHDWPTAAGELSVLGNPVRSEVWLQWPSEFSDLATLSIFSPEGKRLVHQALRRSEGASAAMWQRDRGMPPGVYFAVVKSGPWQGRSRLVLASADARP